MLLAYPARGMSTSPAGTRRLSPELVELQPMHAEDDVAAPKLVATMVKDCVAYVIGLRLRVLRWPCNHDLLVAVLGRCNGR